MTADQFAIWLQGYLGCNVFNWSMGPSVCARSFDIAKIGADVLAAAHTVPAPKLEEQPQ